MTLGPFPNGPSVIWIGLDPLNLVRNSHYKNILFTLRDLLFIKVDKVALVSTSTIPILH